MLAVPFVRLCSSLTSGFAKPTISGDLVCNTGVASGPRRTLQIVSKANPFPSEFDVVACGYQVQRGDKFMKNCKKEFFILVLLAMAVSAFAEPQKIVVGFSQIASESEWRNAETISVQNTFTDEAGFLLVYSETQPQLEARIKSIRSLIARKVDVIVLAGAADTGYGPVLQEAKAAKIPVITVDADVGVADQTYRLTTIGSDPVKEGEKAANWLADYLKKTGQDDGKKRINIVQIEGTQGSTSAIGRSAGFASILAKHSNWKLGHSQAGNFTVEGGKAAMQNFLGADRSIQVVWAHNDDMALGAEQAIKETGLKPGSDIVVIGVGGARSALLALVVGEQNASVECSPLLGAQTFQVVQDAKAGKAIPPRIWTDEGIFDQTNAVAALATSRY